MDTTKEVETITETEKEATQMRLRAIPPDVRRIILERQLEKKIKCNCQYSMEQTIYVIIREYKKLAQMTNM